MNLLVVVSNYPNAGHVYSGAFNERSVQALKRLGHSVEVLAPRPYVPRLLRALNRRWQAYEKIASFETRNGAAVYRPAYVQLPRIGRAFWADRGAYFGCARFIERRHAEKAYDAILSFNLIGAGGLAWRLARRLTIPAAGWATGNDVRVPARSSYGRAVRRALQQFDVVFYQSGELLERAAALQGMTTSQLSAERHIVMPRGIEVPPALRVAARGRIRAELGITDDQVLVLYIGRIVRAKGVYDLLDAIALARKQCSQIAGLLVGAEPGFDESGAVCEMVVSRQELSGVRVLPGYAHERIWDYLSAGDIFAFPSYSEGMPNSLLEAMAAALPAVAFAIPPIVEVDGGIGALRIVPLRNIEAFAAAITELAQSEAERKTLGEKGRQRVLAGFLADEKIRGAVQKLAHLNNASGHRRSLRQTRPKRILSVR